jgi:type IV secretory pathway TrbL component
LETTIVIDTAMLSSILYAMAIAIAYGVWSYLTNTPKEQFNATLFLKSVVIGALVGFIQVYFEMSYEDARQFATSGVFAGILEYIFDHGLNMLLTKAGHIKIVYVAPESTPTAGQGSHD